MQIYIFSYTIVKEKTIKYHLSHLILGMFNVFYLFIFCLFKYTFRCGTGNIYHNFKFSTVYNNTSCSTYHDRWTIVDYMFYT